MWVFGASVYFEVAHTCFPKSILRQHAGHRELNNLTRVLSSLLFERPFFQVSWVAGMVPVQFLLFLFSRHGYLSRVDYDDVNGWDDVSRKVRAVFSQKQSG